MREAGEETEFKNRQEAEEQLTRIVRWYNEQRLHSTLCYLRPADYYRGDPVQLQAARQSETGRSPPSPP